MLHIVGYKSRSHRRRSLVLLLEKRREECDAGPSFVFYSIYLIYFIHHPIIPESHTPSTIHYIHQCVVCGLGLVLGLGLGLGLKYLVIFAARLAEGLSPVSLALSEQQVTSGPPIPSDPIWSRSRSRSDTDLKRVQRAWIADRSLIRSLVYLGVECVIRSLFF